MSVITREEVSTVVGGSVGAFTVKINVIDRVIKGSIKVGYTPHALMIASETLNIENVEDARDLIHLLGETLIELSKVTKK